MGYAPACAREALDMVRAGLGYLAAADAAQLSAATQAECLRGLERADSVITAARASMLAGFTAGQGYADDADYSAVAWLMHRTRDQRYHDALAEAMRWLGFCVMLDSWTTPRRTGRKPSSGRACTAV